MRTIDVQTRREVRLGLLSLFLSGLLWSIALIPRGPGDLADPGSCCRAEFTAGLQTAWIVLVVGDVLLLYGFFGLYRFLASRSESVIPLVAFVVSLAAGALFLALSMFFAVSGPAIATLVTQGEARAIAVVEVNFTSPVGLAWTAIRGLFWVLGPVLFAVAMWRDGGLPRWTGPALAVAFLLLIPVTYVTELLGAALFLVTAGVIAWHGWRASESRSHGRAAAIRPPIDV